MGVGAGPLGAPTVAMLSEEALILYAVFAGFGLLALGIWEHLSPARPRFPPRPSPERDPSRGPGG